MEESVTERRRQQMNAESANSNECVFIYDMICAYNYLCDSNLANDIT